MKFAKVLAHTETELDHLILTLKARVSRGGMDAEDAAEELDMIDNDDARYLKVQFSLICFRCVNILL